MAVLIIVGQHALQTGASVADEHWDGTDEEELSCYVSEVSLAIGSHRRLLIRAALLYS
jgi:hypothetical protein